MAFGSPQEKSDTLLAYLGDSGNIKREILSSGKIFSLAMGLHQERERGLELCWILALSLWNGTQCWSN